MWLWLLSLSIYFWLIKFLFSSFSSLVSNPTIGQQTMEMQKINFACGADSDIMGDHGLVCGTGGERIARHNALRDAIHDTAASAGLAPRKEGRALLPLTRQGRGIGRDCDPPPQGWHKGSGCHRARLCPHRGVQGKYEGYSWSMRPAGYCLHPSGGRVSWRLAQSGVGAAEEAGVCAGQTHWSGGGGDCQPPADKSIFAAAEGAVCSTGSHVLPTPVIGGTQWSVPSIPNLKCS